jgi:uncharacterized Fe-S cluster protein YjdI
MLPAKSGSASPGQFTCKRALGHPAGRPRDSPTPLAEGRATSARKLLTTSDCFSAGIQRMNAASVAAAGQQSRRTVMAQNIVSVSKGDRLTITYDRIRYIHAAECGRSDGNVFDVGRAPWVDANLGEPPAQWSASSKAVPSVPSPTGATTAARKRWRPSAIPSPSRRRVPSARPTALCVGRHVRKRQLRDSTAGSRRVAGCATIRGFNDVPSEEPIKFPSQFYRTCLLLRENARRPVRMDTPWPSEVFGTAVV